MYERPVCHCLDPQYEVHVKPELRWKELRLHVEPQDTECDAWKLLLDLIEQATVDKREEFAPARELGQEKWSQIITLPPTIAKLKSVKHLVLYGSSLIRIPPEIGEMSALEEFTPYTSHLLHWFPYEITRCRNLKRSTVSTRALYGNYKYRPPFPRLPDLIPEIIPANCSVCNGPFQNSGPIQCWISLPVATDVLPLLVHACSNECVCSLPDTGYSQANPQSELPPSQLYVQGPHQGGLELIQPKSEAE